MLSVKLSKGNSKMGSMLSISVPAGVTCRVNAPCRKECYACKGSFCFPNVKNAYSNNLDCYNESKDNFKNTFLAQLPILGAFRWHVSGDIIDKNYLKMMINIANLSKEVKHLAFTKKYELINEFIANGGVIPENLVVVFSAWKGLEFENPYQLPIAYMRDKENLDKRIPDNTKECPSGCSTCMKCWGLKHNESITFNKH